MNINSKRLAIGDLIVCLIVVALYLLISWKSAAEMNVIFVIRFFLAMWLGFILLKGARLLQYMATVDANNEIITRMDSRIIELSFKYKVSHLKMYTKEASLRSLPAAIALLLISIAQAFYGVLSKHYISKHYVEVANLLIMCFVIIYCLSVGNKMQQFMKREFMKYQAANEVRAKNNFRKSVAVSLTFGVLFVAVLAVCCGIPMIQYFYYFIDFNILYLFSSSLFAFYKYFYQGFKIVSGHRFEEVLLVRNKY